MSTYIPALTGVGAQSTTQDRTIDYLNQIAWMYEEEYPWILNVLLGNLKEGGPKDNEDIFKGVAAGKIYDAGSIGVVPSAEYDWPYVDHSIDTCLLYGINEGTGATAALTTTATRAFLPSANGGSGCFPGMLVQAPYSKEYNEEWWTAAELAVTPALDSGETIEIGEMGAETSATIGGVATDGYVVDITRHAGGLTRAAEDNDYDGFAANLSARTSNATTGLYCLMGRDNPYDRGTVGSSPSYSQSEKGFYCRLFGGRFNVSWYEARTKSYLTEPDLTTSGGTLTEKRRKFMCYKEVLQEIYRSLIWDKPFKHVVNGNPRYFLHGLDYWVTQGSVYNTNYDPVKHPDLVYGRDTMIRQWRPDTTAELNEYSLATLMDRVYQHTKPRTMYMIAGRQFWNKFRHVWSLYNKHLPIDSLNKGLNKIVLNVPSIQTEVGELVCLPDSYLSKTHPNTAYIFDADKIKMTGMEKPIGVDKNGQAQYMKSTGTVSDFTSTMPGSLSIPFKEVATGEYAVETDQVGFFGLGLAYSDIDGRSMFKVDWTNINPGEITP